MPYKDSEQRKAKARERYAALTPEQKEAFNKADYQKKKDWYKNPEIKAIRNEMRNKRRAENPELRANERAYAIENRDRNKEYARELRRQYGITQEHVEQMRQAQNNKCAICAQDMVKTCVDHCHATGMVRALLCDGCNKGLGSLRDDAERVRKAAEYLERFKPAVDTGLAQIPFPEPVLLFYQHNMLRRVVKASECGTCGKALTDQASHATYCSRNCKEVAYKRRKRSKQP